MNEMLNVEDLRGNNDEDMDDQIGEENQDYGFEGVEDAEDEAERLQAEETVLNNHLECVK